MHDAEERGRKKNRDMNMKHKKIAIMVLDLQVLFSPTGCYRPATRSLSMKKVEGLGADFLVVDWEKIVLTLGLLGLSR